MLRKIIAYKECVARDITIKHLSNKLARLADATRQPNATQADFYNHNRCLLYTSPSPRDRQKSRMPSSA